jgi:hypothetical protein
MSSPLQKVMWAFVHTLSGEDVPWGLLLEHGARCLGLMTL